MFIRRCRSMRGFVYMRSFVASPNALCNIMSYLLGIKVFRFFFMCSGRLYRFPANSLSNSRQHKTLQSSVLSFSTWHCTCCAVQQLVPPTIIQKDSTITFTLTLQPFLISMTLCSGGRWVVEIQHYILRIEILVPTEKTILPRLYFWQKNRCFQDRFRLYFMAAKQKAPSPPVVVTSERRSTIKTTGNTLLIIC